MKAVIVDIQRDYIIVVNKKGEFIKVQNKYKDRQIGDEIEIREIDTRKLFKKIASIAAALVIVSVLAGYAMAFYRPVTYVTMDVNPSIEISLNRFDRTVDVIGLNEDGKRLVGNVKSYRALPAEKVMETLLERAREQKFLNPESVVMITISNLKDEKKLALGKKLEQTAMKELEKIKGEVGISVQQEDKNKVELYVQHSSIKLHNEAKKLGISEGKLLLYEKLKEKGVNLELENIKKMQVKDLIKELKFTSVNDEKEEDKDKIRKTPQKQTLPDEVKKKKEYPAIGNYNDEVVKAKDEEISDGQEARVDKKVNDAEQSKQREKPEKKRALQIKGKSNNNPGNQKKN
ncbi:Anti-sigma factor N-terminus [Caldanaerovirga acetigignens]|uniref:Anti-sigma factor N-terminus n=1 Tax=Caldanaerovirga acetigignens TaxID=447595 RepID=A0A1M7KQH0_9FIRM|nr:anti-sigma factor domain-containing protein [Caldanaerovirga acetigignens]SHM67706.1 Anti-sigma factor N-terminus [Caldanaerovirga acetigignens]